MENKHPNPNQKQLRGVGVDLPGVVSRQGSTDDVVAKLGQVGVEVAGSYVTALDGLRQQRVAFREALRAGHQEVGDLLDRVRIWRKAVGRSVTTFVPNDLERTASKPKEVLSYAAYLLELARERTGRLPYAEAMIVDLESHLETARGAWQAVQTERSVLRGHEPGSRSVTTMLRAGG